MKFITIIFVWISILERKITIWKLNLIILLAFSYTRTDIYYVKYKTECTDFIRYVTMFVSSVRT